MYTTVIIEDDPMITRLNRRYIEQDSRFAVVQTFSAAHPALFWLRRNPIDLIILDVYMPQMRDVYKRQILPLLVQDGVDGDGRFAGLAVADDQLALTASDRHHRVNGCLLYTSRCV